MPFISRYGPDVRGHGAHLARNVVHLDIRDTVAFQLRSHLADAPVLLFQEFEVTLLQRRHVDLVRGVRLADDQLGLVEPEAAHLGAGVLDRPVVERAPPGAAVRSATDARGARNAYYTRSRAYGGN